MRLAWWGGLAGSCDWPGGKAWLGAEAGLAGRLGGEAEASLAGRLGEELRLAWRGGLAGVEGCEAGLARGEARLAHAIAHGGVRGGSGCAVTCEGVRLRLPAWLAGTGWEAWRELGPAVQVLPRPFNSKSACYTT